MVNPGGLLIETNKVINSIQEGKEQTLFTEEEVVEVKVALKNN